MRISIAVLAALALVPSSAFAATYTVGPTGRQYTQLSTALASLNLEPGDIVLVDGNATYTGGIVVGSEDDGAAGNPVTIRWNRAAGATRPLLSGGQHTIKFEQSNHVVFEGFDVTGGTSSCVFNEAHEVLVRDVLVRDCPSHGILGADQNSGSFTLEYSEVRRSGSGTRRTAARRWWRETPGGWSSRRRRSAACRGRRSPPAPPPAARRRARRA